MTPICSPAGAKYLAMIALSTAVASLFLAMNATILYRERSPTHNIANRLPAKLSTWNGPARSMNILPARLSARVSVDLGTACLMTRASEHFSHASTFQSAVVLHLGFSTRDVLARVANQLVEHHDATGR